MLRANKPPALLARMLTAKTEHDVDGISGNHLDEILGETCDMGNDDERKEVRDWLEYQPHFFDPAFAFTVRAQAIAAIHRLTTEGGGTDEQ